MQYEAFHGTIYSISGWAIPSDDIRNSAGPAAICLSPSIDHALQYCRRFDPTEKIARIQAAIVKARANFDVEAAQTAERALEEESAAWKAAGRLWTIKVYRSVVSARNPMIFDAAGAKHYNLTGKVDRDHLPELSIWALGDQAKAAGHDCLIVENVVDGGHDDPDRNFPSTTIMVFDPSILSAPELMIDREEPA